MLDTAYDSTPEFVEQPDGVTLLRTNVDYVHPLSPAYWPLLRMRVDWCLETLELIISG